MGVGSLVFFGVGFQTEGPGIDSRCHQRPSECIRCTFSQNPWFRKSRSRSLAVYQGIPSLGSFEGIPARIYASFEGNHGKIQMARSTKAKEDWTRNLSSTSFVSGENFPPLGFVKWTLLFRNDVPLALNPIWSLASQMAHNNSNKNSAK